MDVSWILLAAVFKVRYQVISVKPCACSSPTPWWLQAMSIESPVEDVQDLVATVCTTLSDAKDTRKAVTEPQFNVLFQRLALLVAEAAVLLDDHLKHSTICKSFIQRLTLALIATSSTNCQKSCHRFSARDERVQNGTAEFTDRPPAGE